MCNRYNDQWQNHILIETTGKQSNLDWSYEPVKVNSDGQAYDRGPSDQTEDSDKALLYNNTVTLQIVEI